MNLFELFVKIGVDDQASGKLKDLGGKLGNGLKTAAKIGTAAVGAAAAGITALTTAAVNNYAEYEQLVGGVETLFKSSSDTVVQYAQNAYKTAGLSANQYMETVTSFSASLLQSLGGDTGAAAKKADVAITDMADNANKMGTSIEMLQTTYAGFAKQNFTMLDNLKLGYGGTKEEMQRLLDDASKISGIKYDISSFADITDAIHVMQEEMGIAGATALEAGTTIQGSIGAMKGAWTNLVTGFANGEADIGALIENLATTIVGDGTEKNLGVIGNIIPAVQTALEGIGSVIETAVPRLAEMLPGLISQILPPLVSAAVSLVKSLAQYLPSILGALIDAIIDAAPLIIDGIVVAFQAIVEMLPELIQQIADALPVLVPQIIVGLVQMIAILAKNLPQIFIALTEAWLKMWLGIWYGIKEVFSLEKVGEFFSEVWESVKDAFGSVADWFSDIFGEAWEGVKDIFSTGGKVFSGITDGIADAFKTVVNAIIEGINDIIAFPFEKINGFLNLIRNISFLGISPFKKLWKQNPLPIPEIPLLARGGVVDSATLAMIGENGREAIVPLENNKGWIKEIAGELGSYVGGGGDIYININGAKYSDENALAEAIAERLQNMTDRRTAVYA